MKSMFDLSGYQDVKDDADGILETVSKAACRATRLGHRSRSTR